jgi:hypothetical protein
MPLGGEFSGEHIVDETLMKRLPPRATFQEKAFTLSLLVALANAPNASQFLHP